MKKATVILMTLIAVTMKTNAQIPNAGFENWTNGNPDGWWSANVAGVITPITQTSQAHSGNYAVRGEALVALGQLLITPTLMVGTSNNPSFPFNQRPVTFTGYYKFSPATSSGDRFSVTVLLTIGGLNGTGIAIGIGAFSQPVASYTLFSVPLTYGLSDVPNTCIIEISIIGPSVQSPQPTVGSYYILDDLAFEGTTDVGANQTGRPKEFKIFQNYPNPFNPSTTIKYELPKNTFVKISVFDLLGREIQTLVNEAKLPGTYEVKFNGSNLSSGVYIYKIQASEFLQTKKFILLR